MTPSPGRTARRAPAVPRYEDPRLDSRPRRKREGLSRTSPSLELVPAPLDPVIARVTNADIGLFAIRVVLTNAKLRSCVPALLGLAQRLSPFRERVAPPPNAVGSIRFRPLDGVPVRPRRILAELAWSCSRTSARTLSPASVERARPLGQHPVRGRLASNWVRPRGWASMIPVPPALDFSRPLMQEFPTRERKRCYRADDVW